MAISIGYKLITTFSDIFMYDEDSEKQFSEWLSNQLPRIKIPDYQSPVVPGITLSIDYCIEPNDGNHDINLSMWIMDGNEFVDNWDVFDELIDNQEFIQDIELNVINPTILKLNSELKNFTIPTHSGEFGDYVLFYNGTFYMQIYSEFSKNEHTVWNVTPMAFQIIDFEPDY